MHVQEGGFARVPATHLKKTTICVPTLLTVLFICATGIMITIAPRSQAATPQSPTVPQLKQSPPLLCYPFAGTIPPGFRAVRASPAERALRSPRSPPSGRSGARPRLLECPLGASPSVTRYLPFSVLQVISIPVWSDMLCGRFIFFCIQTSNVARAVNSDSAHPVVKESWRWRRDMAQGRTRPADAEVRPERDPRSPQRIPAPIPRAISPPTDTRPLLHFSLLMPKETLRLPSPPASRSAPHAGCAGRASPRSQGARRRGGRRGEGAGSPRGAQPPRRGTRDRVRASNLRHGGQGDESDRRRIFRRGRLGGSRRGGRGPRASGAQKKAEHERGDGSERDGDGRVGAGLRQDFQRGVAEQRVPTRQLVARGRIVARILVAHQRPGLARGVRRRRHAEARPQPRRARGRDPDRVSRAAVGVPAQQHGPRRGRGVLPVRARGRRVGSGRRARAPGGVRGRLQKPRGEAQGPGAVHRRGEHLVGRRADRRPTGSETRGDDQRAHGVPDTADKRQGSQTDRRERRAREDRDIGRRGCRRR